MATPGFNIWELGGWVLPDGSMSARVPNDERALREGALLFTMGVDGIMDIAFWNQDMRGAINSFMASNPPPEGLSMRFHGMEPRGEMMQRILGSRARLLNKRGLKQQWGTPTGINPLLPGPSPEQQDLDELQQEETSEKTAAYPDDTKLPGQPGNPPGNPPANKPLPLAPPSANPPGAVNKPAPAVPPETPGAPPAAARVPSETMNRGEVTGKHAAYPSLFLRKRALRGNFPHTTVGQMKAFLEHFDDAAPIIPVSAAAQTVEIPIYEMWNAGRGQPMISIDTDPFLAHVEKLNKLGSGKKAVQTPQVPALGGMTPLGLSDPRQESRNRKNANGDLAALSRRYHDNLPLQEMRDILQKHGFDPNSMDGIYTGEDGKMHEQCGPRTWVAMTWHKLPRTGVWEIVAYLS